MYSADLFSTLSQLEEDFSWRQDELRLLKNQLQFISKLEDKQRYYKSLILMVYAHYEGFCYTAFIIYINYINKQCLPRKKLNAALRAASFADIFRQYDNKQSKNNLFKKHEDSKLHDVSRQIELLKRMDTFLHETAIIPDIAIDLESNLGPDLLKKALFRLGLPHQSVREQEGQIKRLLATRNNIAHGHQKNFLDDKQYLESASVGLQVMIAVKNIITNALRNKSYLSEVEQNNVSPV